MDSTVVEVAVRQMQEQFVDVPMPQNLEQRVEVVGLSPHEQVQHRTAERILIVRVTQRVY